MTRHLRIDDLAAIALPEQPAFSPDGTQIAYVLRRADLDADRNHRSLWLAGPAGAAPRRVTAGPADTSPAWSPDGTLVAFLRAADSGPPQLWLLPAGGGDPWPVTTLPLGAGPAAWSPDGSQIAFAGPADLMAVPGEDAAGRARRELVPIVADRLDYLADGSGLTRTTRSHVHVLEVASGDCRQLTEGDWNAGQPAWSPDGSQLAFCAAMDGDADLTRRSAVYVTDVKAPVAAPRLAGTGAGSAWSVGWTADGSALLVTGRLDVTDEPAALLLVPLDGGPAASLSAPLDRSIALGAPGYPGAVPQLTADGAAVLFCVGDRGSTRLLAAELAGGAPRPVIADLDCTISGLSIAGGQAAVVLATATSFGEIATIDLATGQRSVWTAHGAGLAGIELADRVEREFTISDGTVVHGWIMRSLGTAAPGPLLLDIHGGPHNSWHPAADDVHLYHHELVARGWTVLLLNPRASDGYGTAFLTAAVGGWGVADARDFLEPIDTLVREGIADPARLAVTGYSYGGYMTCYLTSRDTRFAAAIAGGLISDVTSMAGTADNRRALSDTEFGGRPWAERQRYASQSPFTTVDQVSTPTLILHGETDVRCPFGQAQQWHTALRERGVPARLVIYPGGSHLFVVNGRPSHRLDYNRRVVDWLEQYAG